MEKLMRGTDFLDKIWRSESAIESKRWVGRCKNYHRTKLEAEIELSELLGIEFRFSDYKEM